MFFFFVRTKWDAQKEWHESRKSEKLPIFQYFIHYLLYIKLFANKCFVFVSIYYASTNTNAIIVLPTCTWSSCEYFAFNIYNDRKKSFYFVRIITHIFRFFLIYVNSFKSSIQEEDKLFLTRLIYQNSSTQSNVLCFVGMVDNIFVYVYYISE